MEVAILIVLLIIVFFFLYKRLTKENYASRREKARTITNWWQGNNDPSYERYKIEVPQSDIVEYSSVRELKKGGNLDVSSVEKVIG